ncbi:Uncharacterized protein BP5553_01304 [Venustampulla echinocandica]|uniref:Small ribosomal subunit protein mS41 n=1 Tax=Venustampulla echinocandica TaxID=2656787 RepID=A0A370U0P3_9HELO|nr:Uncharacterized protein BP5553_01304 [Venustampulla echinocandica]RDL41325.1 Uncharacterized protein BP5553_01304 [Venustampulla echinocandica]
MILRPQQLRPISSSLLSFAQSSSQARCLHTTVQPGPIPPPIPFVPDTKTFLKLIGRDLSQYASKIRSWNYLFTITSDELKELGMEPRSRRYLLDWRQKFREGRYGPGGDLKYVENGVAKLRVVKLSEPTGQEHDGRVSVKMNRMVVNVPASFGGPGSVLPEELVRPKGFRVKGAHEMKGPSARPAKGRLNYTVEATEGMWEDKRGRKIDGGERRQAERSEKLHSVGIPEAFGRKAADAY